MNVYCGHFTGSLSLPPDRGTVQKVVVLPTNRSQDEDLILEELQVFKVWTPAKYNITPSGARDKGYRREEETEKQWKGEKQERILKKSGRDDRREEKKEEMKKTGKEDVKGEVGNEKIREDWMAVE